VISFDQNDVNAINSSLSPFFDFSSLITELDGSTDFSLNGPSGAVFGTSVDGLTFLPPAVTNVSSNGTVCDVAIPINSSSLVSFGNQSQLPAGTYQVSLSGFSNLDSYFSLLYASSPNQFWTSLSNSSDPVTIAQLTVQPVMGATLAQARNLGPIGPTVTNVGGELDPESVPSAVDLYEFSLPSGHLWNVGLEVSADRIGSRLLPALSLFNDQGVVLATRNSGTGLLTDPNDPYLFTGLQGGLTYFVGVSGAGNLPDVPGGYNPAKGIPGSVGLNQPGGPFPFELSLIATPHDHPTNLLNFTLNHEDSLDPSPSSITLNFSGPIDLSGLFTPDVQETALDVVDSSGQVWPITPLVYQVASDSLTLVFDQPLAPGNYSLILPSAGGLTDLAGVAVVAPGQPAGVLATWTVSAPGPLSPNNLGTLWPSSGGLVWPAGNASLAGNTALAVGQDATFRWVVSVPGFYKLQPPLAGSEIEFVNSGSGKATVLDPFNSYLMLLDPGVYELKIGNVGLQPTVVHWALEIERLDWEKIVDNGVSPSSALSLMTFAPTPAEPSTGPIQGLLSIPPVPSLPPVPSADPSGGQFGPVPASLFVTLNTGLAGQPGADGQAFAPVGPSVEAASIAVSGGLTGQAVALGNGSPLAPGGRSDDDSSANLDQQAVAIVANGGPIDAAPNVASAQLDPDAVGARADAGALADAKWLVDLGALVHTWFAPALPDTPIKPSTDRSVAPLLMVRNPAAPWSLDPSSSGRNRRSRTMLQGDLSGAAGLIMVGAVAIRLKRPLMKWWRQHPQLPASARRTAPRALSGPHPITRTSRLTTRLRQPR